MSIAQASHRVLEQLEHALDTGHVPDEEKRRAAQLLSRLKSPVHVVLIGLPGSGKSRLVNMLTDSSVIPESASLPPLEVAHGMQPRTVYLMSDGSEQSHDGLVLDRPVPPDTAIVRAELPLAILDNLSLTELSLSGTQAEQKAIASWAMNRADIVLWCSQSFDPTEQALWSSASDTLKDHSFLVLTKADQLQMKGILTDRLAHLEDIVAEEFYGMYPVATIQAISSGGADGRDMDIWTSSGGKALQDAVQRLVETGQNADTDNALMFLSRHASAVPCEERIDAKPTRPPQPTNTSAQAPGKHTASNDRPVAPVKRDPTPAFRQALGFLQNRSELMLAAFEGNRPDKQAFVLDHCLETATRLSEIILDAEQADPDLLDIHEDVMECSDMMVLFHLEKTDDAAADAVTLLLQLKKEMSVASAT